MQELTVEKELLLSEWVYNHSQLIFRTAFYFVKDRMLAEDITQEVFLRAYRNMEHFRGDANVSTWLCRITINASKDYLKSWSYRKLIVTQKFIKQDHHPSAEENLMKSLHENELVQKVMDLPVKFREVIVLYYFEDLKSKEIANLLELPESTVRVRIKRGLEKLRKQLRGGVVDGSYEQFF